MAIDSFRPRPREATQPSPRPARPPPWPAVDRESDSLDRRARGRPASGSTATSPPASTLPRNQVQRWIARGAACGSTAGAAKPSAAARRRRPRRVRAAGAAGGAGAPRGRATCAVLYEDAEIAVLDKPAGLTVHPGAGRATGTLAHRLLDRYPEMAGVGGPGRPGHRPPPRPGDERRPGGGAHAAAYARLSRAFAAREVEQALPGDRLRRAVARRRHRSRRRSAATRSGAQEMAVRAGGRPARTHYRTLGRRGRDLAAGAGPRAPAAPTRSAST